MPELPDVVLYQEHLRARLAGARFEHIRMTSPFLLQTVTPPLETALGQTVRDVRRIGKRLAIELDSGVFLVIHLMIAGRLHWKAAGAKAPGRIGLAAFDFSTGTLILTEAGTKKRATLHVVESEDALRALDPGGLEVLDADLDTFRTALVRESHTVKRTLTDPHVFSGIGNAYSDEILHRAQLSPFRVTSQLAPEEIERLYHATRAVLTEWVARLREQAGQSFPEGVTAFRPEMAVHGRFRKACPVCGAPVQRIVYADNETNYCARCQTGGRILADRALSRLLKSDWPRTLEEMEG